MKNLHYESNSYTTTVIPSTSTTTTSTTSSISSTSTTSEVLIIAGGRLDNAQYSQYAEVFDPSNPSNTCTLPSMSVGRLQPGFSDRTVCAGWYQTPPSCETFDDGEWKISHNLTQERGGPKMWKTPSKSLMVMGGQLASGHVYTTEILKSDGTTTPKFNITQSMSPLCRVEISSSVILLGSQNLQYHENGSFNVLPNLITRRGNVGCSYYVNNDNEKVSHLKIYCLLQH